MAFCLDQVETQKTLDLPLFASRCLDLRTFITKRFFLICFDEEQVPSKTYPKKEHLARSSCLNLALKTEWKGGPHASCLSQWVMNLEHAEFQNEALAAGTK